MLLVAKDIEKKINLHDQKQILYIFKMECRSYHNNTCDWNVHKRMQLTQYTTVELNQTNRTESFITVTFTATGSTQHPQLLVV